MADTTDPLVITLSVAAIRTGPDHSSGAKGRLAIITGNGRTGVATDRLFETVEVIVVRAISDQPDRGRLVDRHLTVGIHTNQLDHLPAVILRPTTVVWMNGRNACPLLISYPARQALAKEQLRQLLSLPACPPPVSTTRPSRPARGNPGTQSTYLITYIIRVDSYHDRRHNNNYYYYNNNNNNRNL